MKRRITGLIALCLGCATTVQTLAAADVTIVDISGKSITDVALREWSAERVVVGTPPQSIALDNVLAMTFGRQSVPLAGGDPLVILANGDRLVVRPVGVFEDVLTANWLRIPSRPLLKLPLETVSAIVFDLPASSDDRQRLYADLQTLPPGQDVALLANGDRVQGEFERLDGAFVQLKSPTGLLKLDRSRVQAIRLNPELTTRPRIAGKRLTLALRDGSRLTARSVELVGAELKCQTFAKQEFLLSVGECVACRVYGARAIPLSDREPAQFTFVPYLSHAWPLIKNGNALRGPLSLRGLESGTGLGMHSRSQVTYDLLPTDREFHATVGIDDCAAGHGSARFAIELDGRRVWDSPELTGRSPALVIPPVKFEGAKKLTLIVDFGLNADVSDYADWCEAVVVKE